jgi:hypothetical protein
MGARIPAKVCFLEHRGEVYVITNWRLRRSENDVAILLKLSPGHRSKYDLLVWQGRPQEKIFRDLFPAKRGARAVPAKAARTAAKQMVSIDVRLLTKEQLRDLINERLSCPVPSLDTLPLDDLRQLLLGVKTLKER